MNIFEKAMKHRQIVLVITSLLVLFGAWSLWVMPRNEFPEFTIRQGLIVGVYPGATSEQVEDQLATKVEQFLFGFKEVNREKTYSISKEGMLIVFVEVNNQVDDPDAFWDKIKFGLDELKMQLPSQVLALIANNDFGDTSALLLTVQSDEKSYRELADQVEIIETELRKIPAVSKIKHFGDQSEQINIYLDQDKLAHYQVSSTNVLAALQMEGAVYFAGEMDNHQVSTPIHISSSFNSEADLRNQIVYADPMGHVIRLGDVATVTREYKEPDSYIRNNGNRSLLISLEMQPGYNIVAFGEEVDLALTKLDAKLPVDVSVNKIADMPAAVDHSIVHFLKEFLIAIIAVIAVTMLFLPFRVASVAGITIPISVFITLGILYLLGVELHTVSLAGLIVVLGMVVDNAIVVIDAHVEKLDHGEKPWDAAWKSARDLFVPVFTATMAIIATYVPLAIFMSGQAGDFVQSLPVTIGVALLVSLAVAALLVPYLSYLFIKKGIHQEETEKKRKSLLDWLQLAYDKTLDGAFRYPKLTLLAGVLSVVIGGIIISQAPRQLFPKVERNQFAVEIYLPEGATLEQTAVVVDSMEALLLAEEKVTNVAAFVGTSSPRFHTTYAPNFPAPNYAQLVVNTLTVEDALAILDEYEIKYRDAFPNAYVRMKQLDMSAASAPIEVRIKGENLADMKAVSEQIQEFMDADEEIIWTRTDYLNPRLGIHVEVNDEVSNRMGLTRGLVAASLASGFSGLPVGTIWEGDYAVPVKVINPPSARSSYDDIRDQQISSPFTMTTVPLRQVAKTTTDWSEGQIIRRNGERTLTVRADIARGILSYKVLDRLMPQIAAMDLPEGVEISYGGEHEAELENYVPLTKALLSGILLIFFILLFQFKELKLVSMVMMTMPLSILGAALGLALTGYPFGMTAFLGVMSLFGIVVRNGIILIDYAQELRAEGMAVLPAAMASGKRRMRPIFLTSFAAAIGVVPMIMSGSPLWGPLGSVVCFGLLVSMILTLYVLPVMYGQMLKSSK
ncbi:efflux RND transporter permease subunit [Pontibacter sp. G13]|uniref:efflux RND transporter permease subunit n=1 Tax=Pontibacter sp. G13 TaxID=3074898 RepID=UPI00288A7ADB|nr:efflux RND transporter permease subunit [Pontibacter sp. G13]WNJ17430.1 efflux RND transporter permease subunit [Pontibacter sp. G13]